MPNEKPSETISGTLQQLLFSPKGGIEGMLLNVGTRVVQLSMEPDDVDFKALAGMVGKKIDATASADHSPKTKHAVHPVFKLRKISKVAGKKPAKHLADEPVQGVVARIHYAKHGQPNGVILKTGEFVHTRPPAMLKLKLKVGSKVVAKGKRRQTVLGTSMLEADAVNGVKLD